MSKTKSAAPKTVTVTEEEFAALKRLRNPRDCALSLRFASGDVERWKAAAAAADESLTEWIEGACESWMLRRGW